MDCESRSPVPILACRTSDINNEVQLFRRVDNVNENKFVACSGLFSEWLKCSKSQVSQSNLVGSSALTDSPRCTSSRKMESQDVKKRSTADGVCYLETNQPCVYFLVVLLLCLSNVGAPCHADTGENVHLSVEEYLLQALDIIGSQAIGRKHLDFDYEKQVALKRTKSAVNFEDTYPAIRAVLDKLPDRHSALVAPVLDPKSRMSKAGQSGSQRYKMPVPVNQLKPCGKVIKRQGKKFAYISVPGLVAYDLASLGNYATSLRRLIVEESKSSPSGWVVDLRRNTGGNNWPMLAALAPLLGDGTIGYFCSTTARSCAWILKDDELTVTESPRHWLDTPLSARSGGCVEIQNGMPVAILIGKNTISAGEIVAIAFKGRPNTKFFGEKTGGLTTAVQGFELVNHAVLFLAVEEDADRNGVLYPTGIEPDEILVQNSSVKGTDSVLTAATSWLLERDERR